MKKIDTTNISGLAKAPFIKDTHDHIKESIQESTGNIVKGLLGSYTTGDLIVLYGCVVSATIPGTSSITAGAIYYNGEIYEVDASASLITTGSDTLVWGVVTTYLAADSSLTWSDGVIRNLHRIDKLALSAGASGSGIANYNGATVKTLPSFQPKSKIIDIGDWNMDSTSTISVAHGLTPSKIRSFNVFIYPDASSTVLLPIDYVDMGGGFSGSATLPSGAANLAGSNIVLIRAAGGSFDNTGFDQTSFNRGYITIMYVD